jgi:hypothetical protein
MHDGRRSGWTHRALIVSFGADPVLWLLSLSLKQSGPDGRQLPAVGGITFENYTGIF